MNVEHRTPRTASDEDAAFIYREWEARTRAHDIDGLVELYAPDAILESPLIPRIMDQHSGVLTGHDQIRLLAPIQQGMLPAPHPMVEGMEERDYYQGKVDGATSAQREWVETNAEHHGAARQDEYDPQMRDAGTPTMSGSRSGAPNAANEDRGFDRSHSVGGGPNEPVAEGGPDKTQEPMDRALLDSETRK